MQKHIYYIIMILILIPFLSFAQRNKTKVKTNTSTSIKKDKDLTADEYIEQFKDIAIQEMERSEIPASITLAQGIHESSYGNSDLAKKAKNHFGIKCTKDWKGQSFMKWDDEEQKSCFRVYKSAEHSYVDHTDFLMNRKRYAFLFDYGRRDYKRWAKGLRKAGYATDIKYPEKLIATIEKYKLDQFDKATGVLAYDTKGKDDKETPFVEGKHKPRSFLFKARKPTLYEANESTYAVSRKGESALAAARRFGIPYGRFLKFNDLKDGTPLIDYQPVYIEPKKSSYQGDENFYKVELDATMYEIAQYYGIKLQSLLSKNLLKEGEEPLNGELIMLKEKAITKPKLRPQNHIDTLPPKYIEEEEIKTNTKKQKKPVAVAVNNVVKRPAPQKLEINTPTYPTIVYADTVELNTSKSKNKEYLNLVVTGGGGASKSNSKNNPFTSHRNSKPIEHSKDRTTLGEDDRKSPDNGANGTRKNDNSNNPFSSSPFSSGTNKTTRLPDTTKNESTHKISSPRINDSTVYGSTRTNDSTGSTKSNNSPFSSTNTGSTKTNNSPFSSTNTDSTKSNNSPYSNTNKGSTKSNNSLTAPKIVENIPTGTKIHVVQKGETLWAIHRLYNVSVDAIKNANAKTSNSIKTGDRILIPVQ